jgi:hypothetical protein
MKTKPPVPPDRIEWDFGQVPPEQYAKATLYEYARESEPLCKAISAWLETPHFGETRAATFFQALKQEGENAAQDIIQPASGPSETALRNIQLYQIINTCPHFPQPFLFNGRSSIRVASQRHGGKPPFSRVRIDPIPKVAKILREEARQTGMNEMDCWEQHIGFKDSYRLMIRWDQMTVNDIKKDFADWLSKEAEKHPELKGKGKRGQVSYAPLKWLAAMRFVKAGFTYRQTQREIDPTGKLVFGNAKNYLPLFLMSSDWNKAIEKGSNLLRDLESGKRIVRFK